MIAATRQVYGPESMGIVAATGCNSVFGSTYPFNPYLVPWTNSLFENSPAVALGIRAGWDQAGHPDRRLWVMGGDGAMYDIGFQALSRMVASGADIKVLVLDTQVYSNTGGQASTASFGGQVTKLSAFGSAIHGRPEPRKELGRILMAHGDVYVAQTTPAHLNHFYRSILEANEFTGPAVVIVYSIGLIQVAGFRAILAIRRTEFVWALVALAGVILLGTLQGIVVAIVVSVLALAQQVASPPVYVLGRKPDTNVFRPQTAEHPEDETFPGLLLLRVEGRIFFLNAAKIGEKIQPLVNRLKPKVVAIDLSGVFDLEYTALKALIEAEKRLGADGISIWLVGLTPSVLQVIERSALGSKLGREQMHFNLEIAVRKYLGTASGDDRSEVPLPPPRSGVSPSPA